MITLKGERHAQITSEGGGNDSVIVAFDLPADSVLKRVVINLNILGVSLAHERETALHYALAAYLVQLDDPDQVVGYEALWDRFVPKYTDVDTLDLNTGSVDTTPFWEPGEANFDEVFDLGDMPLRMYYRRKRLTMADPGNAGLRFQPSETPFEPQWWPGDNVRIEMNKSVHVRAPSVFMLAIAVPSLDDTSTTRPTLTEVEWGRIQYVEATLERSLIDQLDVVEVGATTPWEDSSLLLRKHLAPDVFEEDAASYLTEAFRVYADLHFEHTVPGQISLGTIDLTP